MRLANLTICVVAAVALNVATQSCKPAAVPPSIDLVACVAKEASAGKSIAEIAVACETDVPAVIIALVTKDELKATRAYGEAMRTRAVFASAP